MELFGVPVEFRKLIDTRISVTSALIPQVIFLGKFAFTTPVTLAEVLVHELAHVWLNFLAETSDLQTKDAAETYRLPSGTPGKTTRGVLLAAHFAVSAHAFHVRRTSGANRADYLHRYLTECLQLLRFSEEVTEMGRCVLKNLERYASKTEKPTGRKGDGP